MEKKYRLAGFAGEFPGGSEIVRGGGETLAHWVYSASLEDGQSYFARAFTCAPDNLVFRYQYALALGGYDPKHYRAEIEDALTRASTMKPTTAYETFAQARARELLAALRAKEMKVFAKLVRRGCPPRLALRIVR